MTSDLVDQQATEKAVATLQKGGQGIEAAVHNVGEIDSLSKR